MIARDREQISHLFWFCHFNFVGLTVLYHIHIDHTDEESITKYPHALCISYASHFHEQISGKEELRKGVLISICCFGKILGTKATCGSKALFGVYFQVATPLMEAGAGTQGKNLEIGIIEEHCLMACSLVHSMAHA